MGVYIKEIDELRKEVEELKKKVKKLEDFVFKPDIEKMRTEHGFDSIRG